jgi:hypothetical protein
MMPNDSTVDPELASTIVLWRVSGSCRSIRSAFLGSHVSLVALPCVPIDPGAERVHGTCPTWKRLDIMCRQGREHLGKDADPVASKRVQRIGDLDERQHGMSVRIEVLGQRIRPLENVERGLGHDFGIGDRRREKTGEGARETREDGRVWIVQV